MAKVKIGKWDIEEETLDQQHEHAVAQGQAWQKIEPQAQQARYDLASEHLILELKNGVIFQLPRHLVQGLADATPTAISQVRLVPRGASLHWESFDLDYSLAGLIAGIFGTQAWMIELGRKGGQATSSRKAAAARSNGRKGGRPTKSVPLHKEQVYQLT